MDITKRHFKDSRAGLDRVSNSLKCHQELVPMVSQDSMEEANSHRSRETLTGSWLLQQLHSRLKKVSVLNDLCTFIL